jgi:hypothetical protein
MYNNLYYRAWFFDKCQKKGQLLIFLVAIPGKTASTVASTLFSRWLSRHYLPQEIVSDGGKEFCNEVVNEMLKLESIKKLHPPTTPD